MKTGISQEWKIGLRIWKTAIAVAVSIAICRLLGLTHPVFAGVAAIICVQPTVAGSLKKGLERMQATVIGAAISVIALTLLYHVPQLTVVRPVFVAAAVVLAMVACIKLGWMDSLVLAGATVVVVMVLPQDENIYTYAASRTIITLIGVIIATVVNIVFFPPEYTRSVKKKLLELWSDAGCAYKEAIDSFCGRSIEGAESCALHLETGDKLMEAAVTEMQWLKEESRNLNPAHRRKHGDLEVNIALLECVQEIRKTTARIVETTKGMLTAAPHYAEHDAHVYEILREMAQTSIDEIEEIEKYLRGEAESPAGGRKWSDSVHMSLIAAVRAAHRAPRDVFPLMEVTVVAHEIRWATKILTETIEKISDLE